MTTSTTYGGTTPSQPLGTPHREGEIARIIEQQTAKLPSGTLLWTAGAIMVGSLLLQLAGRKGTSSFLRKWVPTLLIMGLFKKIGKVAGPGRFENQNLGAGAMPSFPSQPEPSSPSRPSSAQPTSASEPRTPSQPSSASKPMPASRASYAAHGHRTGMV